VGPLAQVLVLERSGAVDAVADAYVRAVRALADALEGAATRAAAQAEVSAWLLAALGLDEDEAGGDRERREALWDAAVDVLGDAAALAAVLRVVAARVEGGARPERLNLGSILRAKVGWRARDALRRRAALRARTVEGAPERSVQVGYLAAVVVARVAERFGDDEPLAAVLVRLLSGDTVSEAAAATGLSRQAVYRRLERVRRWIEGAGEALEQARV
jgi:hypothetical protein